MFSSSIIIYAKREKFEWNIYDILYYTHSMKTETNNQELEMAQHIAKVGGAATLGAGLGYLVCEMMGIDNTLARMVFTGGGTILAGGGTVIYLDNLVTGQYNDRFNEIRENASTLVERARSLFAGDQRQYEVVVQRWSRNNGKGKEFGGLTLHLMGSDRNLYLEKHNRSLPNSAPEVYVAPEGEATKGFVDLSTYQRIQQSNGSIEAVFGDVKIK